MACAACGSVAVRSFGRMGCTAVGHHLAAAERSAGDESRETQEPSRLSGLLVDTLAIRRYNTHIATKEHKMSLETFMRNAAAQQQREADDIATSVRYTLTEALAYNKAKIKTNRQSTLQLKNWYAEGYYLRSNGLYYSEHGGVERRKYCTA